MGVILTMTMVMMTALAVTREQERGTMEMLLATPVKPIEVMCGKILPYIIVGYVQVAIILIAAKVLFAVPMLGSLVLLSLALVLFIAANLASGIHFFHDREEPVAGGADDFLFLSAFDAALRLHVSFSRDAGVGAGAGRSLPAHAFLAYRARHSAEGQRRSRNRREPLANHSLSTGCRDRRASTLSQNVGLAFADYG